MVDTGTALTGAALRGKEILMKFLLQQQQQQQHVADGGIKLVDGARDDRGEFNALVGLYLVLPGTRAEVVRPLPKTGAKSRRLLPHVHKWTRVFYK